MNIRTVIMFIALLLVFSSPYVWAEQDEIAIKEQADESWLANAWNKFTVLTRPNNDQKQPKALSKMIKCSVQNFDLFFNLFSEDHDFQRTSTPLPLKLTVYTPKYNATQAEVEAGKDIVEEVIYLSVTENTDKNSSFFPTVVRETLIICTIQLCSDPAEKWKLLLA